MQDSLARSKEIKDMFLNVASSAASLLHTIETQEAWAFLLPVTAALVSSRKLLDDAMTPFAREWMIRDLKDIRGLYSEADILTLTGKVHMELEQPILKVRSEIDQLVAMQKVCASIKDKS